MIFLYTALGLVAAYLLFSLIPSLILYKMIFSRKLVTPGFTARDLIGTRYEPYIDEYIPAEEYIESLDMEKISVTARDGVKLVADYCDNGSDKTVIFSHGFCGNPFNNFCLQAQELYNKGFNLMFIVQRGHGESGGSKIGLGVLEQYDILSWIDFEAKKPNINKILLCGSSMGSTAIAYASDKISSDKVKGMVIDCGFPSPWEQLSYDSKKRHIPPFLVMPEMRLFGLLDLKEDIRVPAGESLKKTGVPALFIHGTKDTTVPYSSGMKNYNACKSEKELISVEGAQHIVAYAAGEEKTSAGLVRFVDKYFD